MRREDHALIAALERAGDRAHEHRLHDDAVQHYQDALNVGSIDVDTRARIAEKLAYALSLSRTPTAASSHFDFAAASYINKPAEPAKMIEMLMQRARQLWLDCRTADAIPLLKQAVELAELSRDPRLCTIAHSRIADYYLGLAQYSDATRHVDAIGEIPESDYEQRATYYTQRAMLAAALGKAPEAYAYFEQALEVAHHERDVINAVIVGWEYAVWALTLGNIRIAKANLERAMLFARQHHIHWQLQGLCLYYADVLYRIGQTEAAQGYLHEALLYDVTAPFLDVSLAIYGIPVALRSNDQAALSRCALTSVIELVFRSGEPGRIAGVAAAFAQWHHAQKQDAEARTLLRRALEGRQDALFRPSWDLALAVAQFGFRSDIPKARRLLTTPAALPASAVPNAYLALFEACAARRKGDDFAAREFASDAARRFASLEWHGLLAFVHDLFPDIPRHVIQTSQERPFVELSYVLTTREQQVAALVLKGLSNRAIADELSIQERTVEAHMTAIMRHLGIRSRHQLTERLHRIR